MEKKLPFRVFSPLYYLWGVEWGWDVLDLHLLHSQKIFILLLFKFLTYLQT